MASDSKTGILADMTLSQVGMDHNLRFLCSKISIQTMLHRHSSLEDLVDSAAEVNNNCYEQYAEIANRTMGKHLQ